MHAGGHARRNRHQAPLAIAAFTRGLPDRRHSRDVCLAAVSAKGDLLKEIDAELRTPEICTAAVRSDGRAIRYIADHLRSEVLCLNAVMNCGSALSYLNDKQSTREVCLAAVTQEGWALKYVSQHIRTAEICVAALKSNAWAISHLNNLDWGDPLLCIWIYNNLDKFAVHIDADRMQYLKMLMSDHVEDAQTESR